MDKRTVSTATPREKTAQTRQRSPAVRPSKTKNRRVDPAQSRANRILTGSRRLRVHGRVKIPVADAAFRLFRHASELPPPPGFKLRLREEGENIAGGIWHVASGKFVASWFHVIAVTNDEWLVAYLPTDCRRFSAALVPFSEATKLPTVLRKAGCRIGSAKLVVEMIQALKPTFNNN